MDLQSPILQSSYVTYDVLRTLINVMDIVQDGYENGTNYKLMTVIRKPIITIVINYVQTSQWQEGIPSNLSLKSVVIVIGILFIPTLLEIYSSD